MPAPLSSNGIPNARITDRGGFINLPHDYPYLDLNDTQTNPQLLARSWKGAVLTNNFLVRYMNESRKDFRLDKEYYIKNYSNTFDQFGSSTPTPNKVEFSSFGSSTPDMDVWTPNLPGLLYNFGTDTLGLNSSKLVTSDGFYLGMGFYIA